MAQQTVVSFVSDLSGEPADETVQFSVGKLAYEVDLTEAEAKQMWSTLAPYVEVARRVRTQKPTRGTRGGAPARADREQRDVIREWARTNGHQVGQRGRIPEEILILFNAAHSAG